MNSLIAALALVLAMASAHAAEPWPSKPVRIIVPTQAGAQPDTAARFLTPQFAAAFGQPFIVDNKPGAQGIVGTSIAKTALPDGYTLIYMFSSNACGNPYLRKSMPYDVARDFEPIGLIGASPIMVVVSSGMGLKTMQDFIAYARTNKGKVSFSTPGVGGAAHLYGEMISRALDLDLLHVPFGGGATAMTAVISGQVQMSIADLSVQQHIAAGKLVGLAVTGDKRWPRLQEVPTLGELGLPSHLIGWMGLMAPGGTPREIVAKLNAELNRATGSTQGREFLLNIGNIASPGTPEDMSVAIRQGCPAWGEAARKAGIQPE